MLIKFFTTTRRPVWCLVVHIAVRRWDQATGGAGLRGLGFMPRLVPFLAATVGGRRTRLATLIRVAEAGAMGLFFAA